MGEQWRSWLVLALELEPEFCIVQRGDQPKQLHRRFLLLEKTFFFSLSHRLPLHSDTQRFRPV